MAGRREEIVAGQWRALLPTAYLLTGTDAQAADLVERGLAAADVRAADPRRAALAGLVRAHLDRWRRIGRGDGAVTGVPADAWWTSPADAEAARTTSAALDRLTPRERTAVVLRWHERLPAAEVGALLGGTDVEAVLDGAVRRLAPEVPSADTLPARLDQLAAQSDATALSPGSALAGVRSVRARRRRRWATGLVAAVALLAAAVLLPRLELPRAVSSDLPAALAGDPVFGLPTRGSLGGDDAFVQAAQDRSWPGGPPDRHVVYAGDVAGARWVLVAGDTDGRLQGRWSTGPAGADPGRLQDGPPLRLVRGAAAAVVAPGGDPGQLAVLVLARPGDTVAVSPGFDVAADGTADRVRTDVPVSDGVAATVLDRPEATAVQYRVSRGGFPADVGTPVRQPADRAVTLPDLSAGPRSGPGPVSGEAVGAALEAVTGPTGLPLDSLEVSVLAAGSFPAPAGVVADAAVLAVVLPNGAVVTSTAYAVERRTTTNTVSCGVQGHPAGTDPRTLTAAARCLSDSGDSSPATTVLVAAPPGVPAVELSTEVAGAPTLTQPLTDGWAVVIEGALGLTRVTVDGRSDAVSGWAADLFAA